MNQHDRCSRLFVGLFLAAILGSQILQAQVQKDQPARESHGHARIIPLGSPYQKWLDEDVRYLITDQERADFAKLTTDGQRDKFVEDFWERRNPIPGSLENAFKTAHYRRIAYTNEQFAANIPGWKTDRGRIYILNGPPDERETHPGGADLATSPDTPASYPTDIWRYHFMEGIGPNVTVEFIDTCRCGNYRLTEDPIQKHPPADKR